MCGSMVDIQSPTTEIRQGKTKKEKKSQDENITYNRAAITNNNNNNTDLNVYHQPLREFTRFVWWMQTKPRAADNA